MDSIWKTLECQAWCRDFDYQEYMRICFETNHVPAPLSKTAYELLCAALDTDYYEELDKEN